MTRRWWWSLLVFPWPAAAQSWTTGAHFAWVEHRVEAGFGIERFSGPALGFDVARRFGNRLTLRVSGQGADLQAAGAGDLDRRMGDAEGSLRFAVAPWWGFYGGLTARAIASDAGRQRWMIGHIGVELQPAFTGERLQATGRFGVIPFTAVRGLSTTSFGVDAAVGLRYDGHGVALAVSYGLERFAFASPDDARRREQVTKLTVSGGIALPRPRAAQN